MLNERLINEAVKIVIEYFAAEGICEETKTIRQRAINWYNHSEIVTPQRLAAVVISGDYRFITWDEILEIEEFYFPSAPIEETYIFIGEIEESLHDSFWR